MGYGKQMNIVYRDDRFKVGWVRGKYSPNDKFIKIIGVDLWRGKPVGFRTPDDREYLDLLEKFDGERFMDAYTDLRAENEDTLKRELGKGFWLGGQFFYNLREDFRKGMTKQELIIKYKMDNSRTKK